MAFLNRLKILLSRYRDKVSIQPMSQVRGSGGQAYLPPAFKRVLFNHIDDASTQRRLG